MKRIIFILIPLTALACIFVLPGCKKVNEYPSHIAQISFPVITLLGPEDTTINRGATWVDPGATWKDTVTGESGKLTVSINTSKDSAYLFIYTATNKNGFQSFAARGVGVTNYNGSLNLTGAYNQSSVNIYQSAKGPLFSIDNADGFGAGDSSVIVIKSDSTISVATIGTYVTGTNGVALPESFTGTQILFQPAFIYTGSPARLTAEPAVIFQYTVNILNVPPIPAQFSQNLQ